MHAIIHFNPAGAVRPPPLVAKTMADYTETESIVGSYETELIYKDYLEESVYQNIARLVGVDENDIAIFDSATRAWLAIMSRYTFNRGSRVGVTPYEYAGSLVFFMNARTAFDLKIEIIPTIGNGDLDLEWMVTTIDEDVAIVSLVYVPSNCGIVNPVYEVGKIVAEMPALYIVDACQAVGQ